MVLEKPKKVATGIDGSELLGEDGEVPVFMDRILTDEDFRLIRKLKRKREEQLEAEEARKANGESEEE
jgi:protein SDA1